MMNNLSVVNAEPSKAFFIDMITRDLDLSHALLDLVDNSIDKAIQTKPTDIMSMLASGSFKSPFRSFEVEVRSSGGKVVVQDNCGGISLDEARDQVFRFGNPEQDHTPAGLSVYGIGMKRAFFKLGKHFRVESSDARDWFVVDVDVDQWERQPQWKFAFAGMGKAGTKQAPVPPGATRLAVTRLREGVRNRLEQTSFQRELLNRLGSTYALFLKAALSLKVNETSVTAKVPVIGSDTDIVPASKLVKSEGVETLIIAGIRPVPADAAGSGWYVFCNGRMVLEADKTATTGWGDLLPEWHSKYRQFAGYVYFRSADVQLLPWTTTKQGVVSESPIYQSALREMQIQARSILTFLSRLYPGDVPSEDVPEKQALEGLKGVTIDQIAPKQTAFHVIPRRVSPRSLISIQYRRPRQIVEQIKQHLKKPNLSASRIGEMTFDYYTQMELDQ